MNTVSTSTVIVLAALLNNGMNENKAIEKVSTAQVIVLRHGFRVNTALAKPCRKAIAYMKIMPQFSNTVLAILNRPFCQGNSASSTKCLCLKLCESKHRLALKV